MRCAKCGTQNPDHHRFCMKCGGELTPPGGQTAVAEQLLREAYVARLRGDISLAVAKAEEALALAPSDASGHKLLGMLYASQNETEKAVAHLEQALRLQPNISEVNDELTRLRKRLERERRRQPQPAMPAPTPPQPQPPAMPIPPPAQPAPPAPPQPTIAAPPAPPQPAPAAAPKSYPDALRQLLVRKEKAEAALLKLEQEAFSAAGDDEQRERLARQHEATLNDAAAHLEALRSEVRAKLDDVAAKRQQWDDELSQVERDLSEGKIDAVAATARRSVLSVRRRAAERAAESLQPLLKADTVAALDAIVGTGTGAETAPAQRPSEPSTAAAPPPVATSAEIAPLVANGPPPPGAAHPTATSSAAPVTAASETGEFVSEKRETAEAGPPTAGLRIAIGNWLSEGWKLLRGNLRSFFRLAAITVLGTWLPPIVLIAAAAASLGKGVSFSNLSTGALAIGSVQIVSVVFAVLWLVVAGTVLGCGSASCVLHFLRTGMWRFDVASAGWVRFRGIWAHVLFLQLIYLLASVGLAVVIVVSLVTIIGPLIIGIGAPLLSIGFFFSGSLVVLKGYDAILALKTSWRRVMPNWGGMFLFLLSLFGINMGAGLAHSIVGALVVIPLLMLLFATYLASPPIGIVVMAAFTAILCGIVMVYYWVIGSWIGTAVLLSFRDNFGIEPVSGLDVPLEYPRSSVPRTAAFVMAGLVVAWLILLPVLRHGGTGSTQPVGPMPQVPRMETTVPRIEVPRPRSEEDQKADAIRRLMTEAEAYMRQADEARAPGDQQTAREMLMRAQQAWQEALRLDPSNQQAKQGLDRCTSLQKFDEGLEYMRQAGLMEAQGGQQQGRVLVEQAIQSFQEALRLDPSNQDAQQRLNEAQTLLGTYGQQ